MNCIRIICAALVAFILIIQAVAFPTIPPVTGWFVSVAVGSVAVPAILGIL